MIAEGAQAVVAVTCGNSAAVNKRWECSITGVVQTGLSGMGAYRDAKLKVSFSRPQIYYPMTTYAYWAGGEGTTLSPATFKFRTRFHEQGVWSWATNCEAGPCVSLHGLSGASPNVAAPASSDPRLVRFGPLGQVLSSWTDPVAGPRYAKYFSLSGSLLNLGGRSFMWIGDSPWVASMRSDLGTWNSYLDSRVALGYTVVHLGPGRFWANPERTNSRKPFEQVSGCSFDPTKEEALPNLCSRARLSFWDTFDQFVEAANQKGLAVLVTGLMGPVGGDLPADACDYHCGAGDPLRDQDVTGPNNPDEDRYPNYDPAKTIARYVTSRLAGNHVILSPGFDDDPISQSYQTIRGVPQTILGLIKAVGAEISQTANPGGWGRPLITNHWGTITSSKMLQIQDEAWLDFQMPQSGANLGVGNTNPDPYAGEALQLTQVTQRARELSPVLLNYTNSAKGVVLGEAIYDDGEPIQGSAANGGRTYHRNAFRARQAGYFGWMTGSIGYSLGIGGVWDWGLCALTSNRPTHCSQYRSRNPSWDQVSEGIDGMTKPSARELGYLGYILRSLNLYSGSGGFTIPNEQWRVANQESDQAKKMVTLRDYHHLFAYLPRNDFFLLNAQGLRGDPAAAIWINPRTYDHNFGPNLKYLQCDATGQNCQVQIASCLANQASCRYCGSMVPVAPASAVFACGFRNPNPNAGTTVGSNDVVFYVSTLPPWASGWAEKSAKTIQAYVGAKAGEDLGVYVSIFNEDGTQVASGVRASSGKCDEPGATATARDGEGDFAVVWHDDLDGDGKREVLLRWIDAAGIPVGGAIHVSEGSDADSSMPQVAMDSAGRATVVWQSSANDSKHVVARSLDKWQLPTGGTVVISGGVGDAAAMSPLVASTPGGSLTITWVENDSELGRQRIVATMASRDLQLTASEITISDGTANLVFPVGAFSAASGTTTVEWEALGGEGAARLMSAVIDPFTATLSQQETLIALHPSDEPGPEVTSEWPEPLWGY